MALLIGRYVNKIDKKGRVSVPKPFRDAFAAGAILTMLAETMIPEANEIGGRAVGLATSLGFAVAASLTFLV